MLASPDFIELSLDDDAIAESAEAIIVEVDDFHDSSGAVLEEIDVVEVLEQLDSTALPDPDFGDPEVEEPDNLKESVSQLMENIELIYNSSPLDIQLLIKPETSIGDLFELIRNYINFPSINQELWFTIEPLGLEIGEENSFTYEFTMSDLVTLIESSNEKNTNQLKIHINERESFYKKFRMMLQGLDINDSTLERTNMNTNTNKRQRRRY